MKCRGSWPAPVAPIRWSGMRLIIVGLSATSGVTAAAGSAGVGGQTGAFGAGGSYPSDERGRTVAYTPDVWTPVFLTFNFALGRVTTDLDGLSFATGANVGANNISPLRGLGAWVNAAGSGATGAQSWDCESYIAGGGDLIDSSTEMTGLLDTLRSYTLSRAKVGPG